MPSKTPPSLVTLSTEGVGDDLTFIVNDRGGGIAVTAVDDSGDPPLFHWLRIYCRASVIAVVAIALLVLLGWADHIPSLMSVLPGLVTMKVNTALGLMFSAISLWLLLPDQGRGRSAQAARLLGLAVALLGAVTLSQYILGKSLGIDELFIDDPLGSIGTSSPGRMAPMTAISFVAIGMALMLLDWRTRRGGRPAQSLSLAVGVLALVALAGYLYHASALYKILLYTQIAVHTLVALLFLSSAIFFARPRDGIAAELTGEGSGSRMPGACSPRCSWSRSFSGGFGCGASRRGTTGRNWVWPCMPPPIFSSSRRWSGQAPGR